MRPQHERETRRWRSSRRSPPSLPTCRSASTRCPRSSTAKSATGKPSTSRARMLTWWLTSTVSIKNCTRSGKRTSPKLIGHVRFNGIGGFDPNCPARMLNRVFECEDPCIWQGQFKVLFKHLLPHPEPPDYYLVAATQNNMGHVSVDAEGWKSDNALLISFSEWRDQQEALLLMPAYSWLTTQVGTFVLEPSPTHRWLATLRLSSVASHR